MGHLLVTNDFPPKIGGIQSYLWELWRRLPPDSTTVFTTPYEGSEAFDAASPVRIIRSRQKVLLPTPTVARQVLTLARSLNVTHVVLDPAVPVGLIGPWLVRQGLTYSVVLHGAEVTIPGRLSFTKAALGLVLRQASHVISGGQYALDEAERCAGRTLESTVIAPGVDTDRFHPLSDIDRQAVRSSAGLPSLGTQPVVFTASRHVPRKGIDTLIDTCAEVAPQVGGICLAIASTGRQRESLERRARRAMRRSGGSLDVRFLGRISDEQLVGLYAASDINATLCRSRWFGLEQEGFGIIFVEGGASGIASLAGDSGGSGEAVIDGVTGAIVPRPVRVAQAAPVLYQLLKDPIKLREMGAAARLRTVEEFDYAKLAVRLNLLLSDLSRTAPVNRI
jgi:phosphatidyl-myo-inositol dimannoside synthase